MSKMDKSVNLLSGNIRSALIRLSMPLVGAAFIQMAYTLVDTAWVGMVGSAAVTAVSIGGTFTWIGNALMLIPQIGGQTLLGQALGSGEIEKARRAASSSIQLILMLTIPYALLLMLLRHPFVAFFDVKSSLINRTAEWYIFTIAFGIPAITFSGVAGALMTAKGDSRTQFYYSSAGMIINIGLDPVLILGLLGMPRLGAVGAGIATVISQYISAALFIWRMSKDREIFSYIRVFRRPDGHQMKKMMRIGFPPAAQSFGFALVSALTGRIITAYGDMAIAVQKVGSQIESVTWMTSDGFGKAMNSFVAQNFGAGNETRIRKGFKSSVVMMIVFGAFTGSMLYLFARPLFSIFIHEEHVIDMGADYLRILSISQLFMCLESVAAGSFRGVGRTRLQSAISLILTVVRLPFGIWLCDAMNSINGMWWVISASSILKGTSLAFLFRRYMNTRMDQDLRASV